MRHPLPTSDHGEQRAGGATCSGCGGEVPAGASFCPRCGRRLGWSCAGCGAACDADFAFCPRCGSARDPAPGAAAPAPSADPSITHAGDADADAAPRAAAPRAAAPHAAAPAPPADAGGDADRRQVTIVFADLSGFTSLAERLDPETVRAFQNALFDAMARAIARYDGFVEKFVGDAVMAVFGAPRAHEDDPVRALQAADAMLHDVERLGRQWASRLGRPVTLHVGVHTGAVVAGSLGHGAAGAYAVSGDTVNTAARLLAAAEPGTVLVSEATQRLARHRFAFEPAAELALRGKAQPIRVHRLAGIRADAGSARGLAELGLTAPLVGRDAALECLLAAFDRMQRGRAQFVRVVGDAGAGKSRLLAEWFARLEGDPRLAATAVRRAACSSIGEPTYGVFGALFREAYRVEAGDSLQVARGKLHAGMTGLGAEAGEAAAIAQVLDVLLGVQQARPRDIDPEQLRRQVTLAARALVERRLAQQPVLIVVDDLHWADAASTDLLHDLVEQLADRRLMLLVLQRPDGPPPPVTRAELSTIELGPLDGEATRALVGHLLGGLDDGAQPVRDLVLQRSGGNPLFAEEIVRSLVGRGLLVRRDNRWVCEAQCDDADVPPTLYGLLLSRIDRLHGEDRRTLQEAAVLGAAFERTLLLDIATDPRAVEPALRRLAAADLLRPEAPDGRRWRFAHALLHDVAYQNLLLARRAELHRRAGCALERRLGPEHATPAGEARRPQRLAELAALGHHWSLSTDKPRGARYLLAAGDWARAVYANDDALRHYEAALRTLAEAAIDGAAPIAEVEAIGLDARERRADLLALRGQRGDAQAGYEAILQAAEAHDPMRAARVLRKLGCLHWDAGDRERAGACFEAGLQRLGDGGDAIERAHLYQEMGRLAFRAGDNSTALSLAQRALAVLPASAEGSEEREAATVRAHACNTLGIALARLGRPAEAVEQIERSVAQAEANDMLQAACRGYTNLGVLYASLDPQRSIDTCLRGLQTARKVGDLGFQSRLYANLAVAYCALTDRCEDEGIEAANAAADLDRRLGLLDHLAVPLIVLGQIYQCRGDHARAFESYQEALRLAERVDEPQLLFPCYDGLATLHLDAGQAAQAETYLAKAQAVCERAGIEPDALMVLPFLC